MVFFCFLSCRAIGILNDKIENLEAENESLQSEINAMQSKQEELLRLKTEEDLLEIRNLEAGTILSMENIKSHMYDYFSISEIKEDDSVYNRINGKSYQDNRYISLSDLRYLKVLHYNFDHEIQVGEIIVNAAISEDVLNIFKELFLIEYEIQSMHLIDDYWTGDGRTSDSASIEENNTSAFCFRKITGGSRLSNHAYGCAIDINPQQNPYVWYENGSKQWDHSNADYYIDRSTGDPHMIVKGDDCYRIFEKYGFSWGGEWSNPIDYQHFERKLY